MKREEFRRLERYHTEAYATVTDWCGAAQDGPLTRVGQHRWSYATHSRECLNCGRHEPLPPPGVVPHG